MKDIARLHEKEQLSRMKVEEMSNEQLLKEYERLLEYNHGGKSSLSKREEELFNELCERLVKESV